MTNIQQISVIEVDSGNFQQLWPSLILAIRSSTFIAIDTELSGLGDRKQLFAKAVDDRYKAVCEVAKTRSIISLGLSCFKLQQTPVADHSVTFQVQTYNIFVLCMDSYVVEPLALQFLVSHGFDFNRQYKLGLPYRRGNDQTVCENLHQSLRQLFTEVLLSHVPIVLHNALVDLVFLYESLYASLPGSLESFLADLSEMFPAGIYDTKYIVEFKARWSSSFLEYAFRKSVRDNCLRASNSLSHFNIVHPNYQTALMFNCISIHVFGPSEADDHHKTTNICQHYANHGWCSAGSRCCNSHDIDLILDYEDFAISTQRRQQQRKEKQRERQTKCLSSVEVDVCCSAVEESMSRQTQNNTAAAGAVASQQPSSVINDQPQQQQISSGGHRAGFDAFMTGYILAWSTIHYAQMPPSATNCITVSEMLADTNAELVNKVYLGGKDFPLQVTHSCFAKKSKSHSTKWQQINCDL